MVDTSYELLGARLKEARRVAVISHVRPDGDAVGSVLGLGLALDAQGRQVQMVLADGVPSGLRHLEGSERIVNRLDGEVDLTIALDCADPARLGPVLEDGRAVDANIDHHVTNQYYGAINLVDHRAVATAAMLAEAMPDWGLAISPPVAAALLTGIITDTLGFRTSNMSAQALRVAADLVEAGADLPELYARALVLRKFAALKLWGQGLAELAQEGRLVWTTLRQSARQAAGYPGSDDADLVNLLSAVQDADVALIFIEQPAGEVKVSWRAAPGLDVSGIASQFGGGGHPAAAGAMIEGPLEVVQEQVLQATRQLLQLPEQAASAELREPGILG